jgi:hypothetical protein
LLNIAENFPLRKLKPSFIPAIAWLIISTALLTIPGKAFPSEDWLSAFFAKIWFDKWVHIGIFLLLVVLWCWGFSNSKRAQSKKRNLFLVIALIWFAYGIAMEFVQRDLVPFRSFDLLDIVADGVGCVIGLLFSYWKLIPKAGLK